MTDIKELIHEIQQGSIRALSKAITLAESSLETERDAALSVIEAIPTRQDAMRIGISGTPGAGKSTLIDTLGRHILSQTEYKIAVLTIDPSSSQNKGSILGDKTRMTSLSTNDRVFVRPSPSGKQLGGLARNTRLAMALCECAGFDIVIVESVGVGQGEIEMKQLTDVFSLVINPGGGDELQGIKRGIMEVADIILINKADGNNELLAKTTAKEYNIALHLRPKKENEWFPKVLICSATQETNIDKVWDTVLNYYLFLQKNGKVKALRNEQLRYWTKRAIQDKLLEQIDQYSDAIEAEIKNGLLPERIAKNLLD